MVVCATLSQHDSRYVRWVDGCCIVAYIGYGNGLDASIGALYPKVENLYVSGGGWELVERGGGGVAEYLPLLPPAYSDSLCGNDNNACAHFITVRSLSVRLHELCNSHYSQKL